MTIGIYAITHISSGKKYIGKSINIEKRLITHKCSTTSKVRSSDTNRHLYNAVQKYGWSAFEIEIIESFQTVNEELIAERELYWIDTYNTINRSKGYNLRRDSSTRMIIHPETLKSMSNRKGENNSNFGNKWTVEMRENMSKIAKSRHQSGKYYGNEWKEKQSLNSKDFWKSNPDVKQKVGEQVSIKKTKYKINQYTKEGEFIKEWIGMRNLLLSNPSYKRNGIYSVCSGEKPSMYGFVWKKELLTDEN